MEVVMLERYFLKPATVDRIRASWIGDPIEQYVDWLAENGYAARNVLRRVPLLVRFGAFAAAQGAMRWDELPVHVETFVAAWLQARYGHTRGPARRKVAGDVRNAIEQMFRVALPDRAAMNHRPHAPDPFVRQSPGFWVYLRDERGLRETSIQHYRHFLRHFETYLAHIGYHDLGALSPPVLSALVTESASAFGRSTMTGLCSALRVFLRYLRREGIVGRDLGGAVEPQTIPPWQSNPLRAPRRNGETEVTVG
jgi:integrase/recombinase XerD